MVEVQHKYGCLTVLDNGEEASHSDEYSINIEKRNAIIRSLQPLIEERENLLADNSSLFDTEKQRTITEANWRFHLRLKQLEEDIKIKSYQLCSIESKLDIHYKCQCKCGKIHFYNARTIESNPKYCFYPIPISTKFTYSTRAINAKARKVKKYDGFECVKLCDQSECMPSDEYCENYNRYKTKQLAIKEEKQNEAIECIPRVFANNYDIDFTGKQYESLLVEECTNDHLESEPSFNYTQNHHKRWHDITVYKQYRCRCVLCGKVQLVNCDQFGIYPPTEYGYNACDGYWSDVSCDCHLHSSFQWIVCKILFEADINYTVEYSFSDLFGNKGVNLLRFDFAVFNTDRSIKCLIECQGEQHFHPVQEFGGERQFEDQVKNDELKRSYCEAHNIQLIEISYQEKKYEQVLDILRKHGIV